jgi:hypothetical protein
MNSRTSKIDTTSNSKRKQLLMIIPFIFVLGFPARRIRFFAYLSSFNASSLELWRFINTTFCVPCTSMWKHNTSSLWMNTLDLMFWLFYIHNPSKLAILTSHHSRCTFFVDCANKYANCINTSIDCIDTFANYADKSINCAHTYYNCANTSIDSTDAFNALTSNFYILDFFPL